MTEDIKKETENVQQTNGQTGLVNNQAQMVNDIVGEAVNQPTAEEKERERLRKILGDTRIRTDTVVPDLEYALEVDGTGFFARRDIHAVKAKAKAGKTTTLKVFIAALLQGEMFRVKSLLEKPRIVFFDTEQNRKDTKSILDDVAAMTGLSPEAIDSQVVLHSLRRVDREDLLPLLCQALMDEKPDVVFVDGIVEFVSSFNDESESKQIIKDLLGLSEEYNCAIICVLHTNKADEDHNMRGHLGTMLAKRQPRFWSARRSAAAVSSLFRVRSHAMKSQPSGALCLPRTGVSSMLPNSVNFNSSSVRRNNSRNVRKPLKRKNRNASKSA